MAEFAKLGVTELNTSPYTLLEVSFPPPRKEVTSRDFAKKDGAQILRERYRNSVRTMRIRINGSSKDNYGSLMQTLQDQINTQDVVLEYKPNNSSNSNFSDVLVGSKNNKIDLRLVQSNVAEVDITLECKPFWRGSELTVAAQTLSPTPSKITLGDIKGDVNAPCSIEVAAVGANSIGTNLVVGSRENPMNEGQFTPIKDFQGSTLAGAFNGKATDTTVDTSWTSLTGVDDNINGLAAASATVQVAVGDGGKIFTTADGWGTVSDIAHGLTSQDLNAISWAGGTTYYACGNAGVILKSTDSGANWTALSSEVTEDLFDISFVSTTEGWACGGTTSGAGRIRITVDGSAWTTAKNATATKYTALSAVSATVCHAFGIDVFDQPIHIRTIDGSAWSGAQMATTGTFVPTGATAPSASIVFVCGEAGKIYKSIDADDADPTDAVWTLQTSGVASDLYNIKAQSTSVVWTCGANGVILYTSTGGTTWTAQTSGTSAKLNAIAIVDASNVNIAGDGYIVLDTDDAGTTWTQPIAAWALTSDYDGRWDVYAIIKKSSTGAGDMRVSSGWGGGSVITQASVAVTAGSALQTVYLGEISIPATTISDNVTASRAIKVEGKLDAGSETWSSDVFWIVPVDGEVARTTAAATAASHITFDSDKNAVNQGSTIVTWIGSPINLRPGQNNIVICETAGIDDAVVTVKYKPLFLLPVA